MNLAPYARAFDLRGKTAIVTGGAVGIGAACAIRLAELGADVAILDPDEANGDATAAAIRANGDMARRIGCDLGEVASIEAAIAQVLALSGRIDVVVNNAGIFPMAPALDLSERTWDRVLDVNLKGAFFCSQLAARAMVKGREGGAIVNIASIDAIHPTGSLVHYDASKGGLVMMTKSLAKELAPFGIRVNAIAPGAIDTPGASAALSDDTVRKAFLSRIPLGRMGAPDDIARAVAFRAAPASDYVTGALLVVDGGYLQA
ncbi:MAG: SDR family NAD(P)-dependent oxidoreductase [Polyangiales bacterium]